MPVRIAQFSLLIADYDEALDFFARIGFECREDTALGKGKRWVRIAPPGGETEILLARATEDRQAASIGGQGGGRVWLFLETEDFENDYQRLQAAGVEFETLPREEPYGRVVVWKDHGEIAGTSSSTLIPTGAGQGNRHSEPPFAA